MSAGIFGLRDAIEAFDPGRQIKFETYCTLRIRGAMLDELRAMDWVPRLVRSRSQKYREAMAGLETELGRAPTDDELAQRMHLSPTEFHKLRHDGEAVSVTTLSTSPWPSARDGDRPEAANIRDKASVDPVQQAHQRDVWELITRGLSRAERLVLILYYHEEMTMKEIGKTLDLSESRVSQMHTSILGRLKKQLLERRRWASRVKPELQRLAIPLP